MHFILYKATAPNGKGYIGQTTMPLSQRIKAHEKTANGIFPRALRKYGREMQWRVIGNYDNAQELNAAEIAAIKSHNTLAPHGYNLAGGGRGETCSKELSEKRRAAGIARWQNPEYRARTIAKLKKTCNAPEHRNAISVRQKRRYADPAARLITAAAVKRARSR